MNEKLTATTAKHYATRIASECSECFTNVKAARVLGKWCVEINGGAGAYYGKSIKTVEGAEDTIRVFGNASV